MKKILFVCLGNICRSPSAEGVMTQMVNDSGLREKVTCDSAGTIGFHAGEKPDPRSHQHALKRGIDLNSVARKFNSQEDFTNFDYILAMDKKNYQDILKLDEKKLYHHKVFKMTDFCQKMTWTEVPDPYHHGEEGFELVLDILEDSCQGLLEKLKKEVF